MESSSEISGRIILVPTPIGNMSDITLRALEILRSADRIACEDTRHSGQLLAHHGISGKPLVSLHEHNETRRAPDLHSRFYRDHPQSPPRSSDQDFPATHSASADSSR
jgi:16S rRNA (cytidine1402-2'-O)-methyltransferase